MSVPRREKAVQQRCVVGGQVDLVGGRGGVSGWPERLPRRPGANQCGGCLLGGEAGLPISVRVTLNAVGKWFLRRTRICRRLPGKRLPLSHGKVVRLLTTRCPSGVNQALHTGSVWPSRVRMRRPSSASQSSAPGARVSLPGTIHVNGDHQTPGVRAERVPPRLPAQFPGCPPSAPCARRRSGAQNPHCRRVLFNLPRGQKPLHKASDPCPAPGAEAGPREIHRPGRPHWPPRAAAPPG